MLYRESLFRSQTVLSLSLSLSLIVNTIRTFLSLSYVNGGDCENLPLSLSLM